jgi:ankyrin repeat protein
MAQAKQSVVLSTAQLAKLLRAASCQLSAVKRYLEQGGKPDVMVGLNTSAYGEVKIPFLMKAIVGHHVPGNAGSLELLLEAGAKLNISAVHEGYNRTALMWACECPCCSLPVQLLIKHGADVCLQTADGSSALHVAASHGSVEKCKLILEASKGRALSLRKTSGVAPIAEAVGKGHLAVVKLLQEHGADLQVTNGTGQTLMHYAASIASVAVIRHLLNSGVAAHAMNNNHSTPVHLAAGTGSVQAVQLLLNNGAVPSTVTLDAGHNALHVAAQGGHVPVINLLLDSGMQVDPTAASGISALMFAAIKGQNDAIKQLLTRGADVNYTDRDNRTALFYAVAANQSSSVKLLLQRSASLTIGSAQARIAPLYLAVSSGYVQCAKLLLAAGVSAATVYSNVNSCLYTAGTLADAAAVEMTKLLLEHGAAASIDALLGAGCDCCGSGTALMLCTKAAVTKLLLAAGADVHIANNRGTTCLHIAAAHGYSAPVLCLLIKAGADLHAVNRDNKTAADVAHSKGNTLGESLLVRAARDMPPILAVD